LTLPNIAANKYFYAFGYSSAVKEEEGMKRTLGTIASILLVITLALNVGCAAGGTDISLEGVTLGAVTVDGKPVTGLPSEKINLLLEVSARKVTVKYTSDGTVLTMNPSGATIEIKASGILIKGVKAEQVKIEWAVSEQD
jgi:hypothetical protein